MALYELNDKEVAAALEMLNTALKQLGDPAAQAYLVIKQKLSTPIKPEEKKEDVKPNKCDK